MDISVPEIVGQFLGFAIVFLILKRFAWKPILGLLDERRQSISDSFDEIVRKNEEADSRKAQYEQELRNIDAKAREKIQEAIREGNEAASRIRDQAHEERRKRLERAEEEVLLAVESAREDMRRRTVDLALQAAEKVLRDKLDDEQHRRLVTRYVEEIEKAS